MTESEQQSDEGCLRAENARLQAEVACLKQEQERRQEWHSPYAVLQNSVQCLTDADDSEAFLSRVLIEIAYNVGASALFLLRYEAANNSLILHLSYLNGKLRWGPSGDEFRIFAAPIPADITPAFALMCRERRFITPANCPIPAQEFAWPGVMEEMAHYPLSDVAHLALMVGDTPVGSLGLNFQDGKRLREADQPLVQALAQQAALALRLSYLSEQAKQAAISREQEKAAQERAAELEAVNEALRRGVEGIAGDAGLDAMLGSLLVEAMRVCGAAGAGITGWKQRCFDRHHCVAQDGAIVPPAVWEQEAIFRESAEVLGRNAGGFTFELLSTPVSKIKVEDAWNWWPAAAEYHTRHGHVEVWNVPCVLRGELLAHLGLAFREPRPLNETTVGTLTALAQQITLALELTRLADDARQIAVAQEREKVAQIRAAELARANKALQRSVAQLANIEEVSQFSAKVLKSIVEQTGATSGALFRYDPAFEAVQMQAMILHGEQTDISSDPRMELWRRPFPTASFEAGWRKTISLPEGYFVEQITAEEPDSAEGVGAWHIDMGHVSVSTFPLLRGEEPLGFIGLAFSAPFSLTPEKIELTRALAQQATLAMELARLAEKAKQVAIAREREKAARERAAELAKSNKALEAEVTERKRAEQVSRGQTEAMIRALNVLAEEPTLDAFLGHVLCAIATQVHTRMCALYLHDRASDTLSLHMTYHEGQIIQGMQQLGHPSAAQSFPAHLNRFWQVLVESRRPVVIADVENDALLEHHDWLSANGIRSLLIVPLLHGTEVIGCLGVRSREVRVFAPEEIELAQALAHQITLAVNTTRLAEDAKQVAVVQAQKRAAQERTAALARISAAGRSSLQRLANRPDLGAFLGEVLTVCVEHFQAFGGSLWLYDHAEDVVELLLFYREGRVQQAGGGGHPGEQATVRPRWRINMATLIRGKVTDHRAPDFVGVVPEFVPALQADGILSALCIPIFLGEECQGLMTFTFRDDRYLTPEEEQLAHTLANQAALSLELTRLAEQSRKTAVLEERNRMAREIHDTLAQGFTGIAVQLEATKRGLPPGAEQSLQSITQARELALSCLEQARRSIWALRPQSLEHNSLAAAITENTARQTANSPVRALVEIQGQAYPLPPFAEDQLYRIAQEAVANAVKYAHTEAVWVELLYTPDAVRLTIRDEGRGFSPHASLSSARSGFGLTSMRERTQQIGGNIVIASEPGQGTQITVVVPRSEPPQGVNYA